ncbi:MAG: diacylglycerol kinase family lipid kinase [Spirochaetales bacterium]|nr:diacylglycerol kinase family lipid kinase [Candidatus Physcosoma equi]
MAKKRALLIINPNASKGRGRSKAKSISDYLNQHGLQCTVAYTINQGHAVLLAKSGVENGFDTIIAAGGDGTVNEVLNGIMKSSHPEKVKMGIIPVGRGNDFAWVAGISTNQEKAADRILSGKTRSCDVGFCTGTGREDGTYFFNGMGFGFESMVNFKARDMKHVNGMASHVLAFLCILFAPPKGYDLKISVDGEEKSVKCQQLSINNGRRMGSSFLLTPKAEINDGLLDIMHTTKVCQGFGLIGLAINFLRGKVVSDKESFFYGNAKKVTVTSVGEAMEVHADGEEVSREGREYSIEILPSAIQLF